jgi:membrane protein
MADTTAGKFRKFQEEALALWNGEDRTRSDAKLQSRAWRFLHFWVLVAHSFQRNRGPVRASALAYTTLLALIPMLAVAVSVTTSFLKSDTKRTGELIERLIKNVAPQLNLLPKGDAEEASVDRAIVVEKIIGYINNVDSGKLGVTAVLALIFVAISLLATIEATFNDIWGVARGRSWLSRIVQYWATLTLGPLFVVTAIGFQTSPYLLRTKGFVDSNPLASYTLSRLFPLILLILIFTLFYRQIPNTKVRWGAALVGGIFGACLWQLNNMSSALYLSRVVTYSKIYGSLGAIPIFLAGLYLSWLILLLGAQVAYAWQNRETYKQAKQAEQVNERGREFVALRLMACVCRYFQHGEPPPTRFQIASELVIPSQLVAFVVTDLLHARILVEVLGEETGYVPARPLGQITAAHILDALRTGSGFEIETRDDQDRILLRKEFEKILLAETSAANHLTMDALARQMSRPPTSLKTA